MNSVFHNIRSTMQAFIDMIIREMYQNKETSQETFEITTREK